MIIKMNDLDKAKKVIATTTKQQRLRNVSEETGIPLATIHSYSAHPDNMVNVVWDRVYKIGQILSPDDSGEKTEFDKAKAVITNPDLTTPEIHRLSALPYTTIDAYRKDIKRLNKAAWKRIHQLAQIYDETMKTNNLTL